LTVSLISPKAATTYASKREIGRRLTRAAAGKIAMRQTTYGEDNRGAHLLSRSGRSLTIETTQVSIELSGPDLERLVSVADGPGFLRGRHRIASDNRVDNTS
jgi:hypothetical protein